MKNYEKYVDEIKNYKGQNFCKDFVMPNIPKSENCGGLACGACYMLQAIWLMEEYEEPEEPEVDWSKVEVDTPIFVRNSEDENWHKRHFAKYKDGVIYTWDNGQTSWTKTYIMTAWKYAKLAESEEKCEKLSKEETKETETDWSKVEVDTPIFVRNSEIEWWERRHFAKYKDGVVYAWQGRLTSWTTDNTYPWEYAKLAESEEE